jgi:hypothetical protein
MSLSYANDFQRKYKQEKQNAGMLSTNTGSPLQDINNRNANTLSQLSSFSTPTRQATQQRISEATYTRPNYGSYVGVKSSGNNGASKGSTGSTYTSISNQNIAASQQPTDQPLTSNSTPSTPHAAPSYNNSYQEYLNKILANARNAYNNNLNAINSMYGNRMSSLNSRYNSGRDTLSATNAQQQEALRKAKEQAQRQAYIQSQEAERDMQQNLSAQGLSGGASESTLASMRNNYASNRNSNEEEYLNNAASLNASYQSELANLENQYQQLIDALNAEKASAIMQNENALANAGTATINQFADYAYNMDYLNANAALNQQAQERQAELNDYYSAKQDARDYANKVNLIQAENAMKQRSNNNAILSAIKSRLRNAGYSEEQILQIVGE